MTTFAWKNAALTAFGTLLLLPFGLQAQGAAKVYGKAGNWEIKKFPKYCVATVAFDGDRSLRLYSGADSFSFGFMGVGTGTAGAKVPVTYWFDKNPKQTRAAVKRLNQNEDGGAPWLIFVDPASEPSHAGDFELAKSVTFTYKANGAQQTETYSLKDAKTAFAKLFQCSGQ
jgi:hypothetical protein